MTQAASSVVADHAAKFSDTRLRQAALVGQERALASEHTRLTKEIALAQAQLEIAPKVEVAFEYLQERAHRRAVGELEGLLTAFVEDVVPQAGTIRLELGTERQAPALDIFLDNGGELESILDGNGGGLTNAVVTGLAFSALAKSENRQLMVLDEPDCWLKARYIPAFTKVIAQVANPTEEAPGCQTLMISHNDVGLMDEGAHLQELHMEMDPEAYATRAGLAVRYEGEAGPCAYVTWEEGGGRNGTLVIRYRNDATADADNNALTKGYPWVQSLSGARPWADRDAPGLRAIEVFNLRHHAYTRMELSSGLNVLAGDINAGKSTLYFASLRAVAYGETDDTMIRHGAAFCRIRLELESGVVVELERRRKGNPRVLYRVFQDGMMLHEGSPGKKNSVPDFVQNVLKVSKIDDLDVQLRSQKEPVFLLNETSSRRANILSVGREAGILQQVMELHRVKLRRTRDSLRRNEPEHATLSRKLKAMEPLASLQSLSELLADTLAHLQNEGKSILALSSLLVELENTDAVLRAVDAAGADVPAPALPLLADTQAMLSLINELAENDAISGVPLPGVAPAVPDARGYALVQTLASMISELEKVELLAGLPLPQEAPAVPDAARFAKTEALARMVTELAQCDGVAILAERLPGEPVAQSLYDTQAILTRGLALRQADEELAELEKVLAAGEASLAQANSDYEAVKAELGVCPACERPFDGHAHARHHH